MRNLHKAYYKDYFKNLNFGYLLNNGEEPKAEIKRRNAYFSVPNLLHIIPINPLVNHFFELKIDYPGLVTGVGINHEAKIEGEFKLGMHFDWTYGMPVVYGSSVKGVLRNAFITKMEKGKIIEYDDFFLKEVTGHNWEQKEIETLFNTIFEGKGADGNNLSIYDRDIFFDAVITKADNEGRILCSDSITPHGDNPLKNPTPITFMKIAPGCEIEFRFKLTNNGLPANKKKELFNKILITLGVGAKTNVGYGQLKNVQ